MVSEIAVAIKSIPRKVILWVLKIVYQIQFISFTLKL